MRKNFTTKTIGVCLLIGPAAIYSWKFGIFLSSEHSRWSEFGSFISGIYTPFLTALTIFLLAKQYQLQSESNSHQHDQAIIQQLRNDIDFYIQQLQSLISEKVHESQTIRDFLHTNFQPDNVLLLDDEYTRKIAEDLDKKYPSLISLIFATQSILSILSSDKNAIYSINYTSSMQRMMASISFETCVALDNYHRARTGGELTPRYRFSPLLLTGRIQK